MELHKCLLLSSLEDSGGVLTGQGCVLTGERPHSGSESVGTLRDPC